MRHKWTRTTALCALLLAAMGAQGCSSSVTPGSSGSGSGAGGSGSGGGGQGAGGPGVAPTPGYALVNAGGQAQSQNYRMVFTLGQSSPSQTRTSSPSYNMQGGLIGATGSLK